MPFENSSRIAGFYLPGFPNIQSLKLKTFDSANSSQFGSRMDPENALGDQRIYGDDPRTQPNRARIGSAE
jgi:hypothetical protein